MANKSFIVQYIIKARDKFSAAAAKVAKSSDLMERSVTRAKTAMIAITAKIKQVKSGLIQSLPSLEAMKAKWKQVGIQIALTKERFASMKKAMEGVRNFGIKMTAAVTLPIGLMINSFKNAARDAVETRSKFRTVFKDMTSESQGAATSLANNFGLTGTSARQLLGDTGDLLTGLGFTQQGALDLSVKVNELAVDLASFTNFSGGAEGASAALTKALLGERESIKSLGIAIGEKDVKAKISKLIAEGQRFGSLRQAKAAATLALAIEQSKNAMGDFARTSGDLANQERITAARIQDLKESFGKVLLPIALKVTKAIRSIAERLTALSPRTQKIILIVAALAATLGPLLLLIGGLGLAIPALAVGFTALGGAVTLAFGPLGIIAAGLAAVAVLIIRNWGQVKAFFSGFADGINAKFGPTLSNLVSKFKEAAKVIANLFATDSEASKNLLEFANIGRLVGDIIGGALDIIVRTLSGVGEIIGQIMGAVLGGDFGQFDIGAIKAEFLGTAQTAPAEITSTNNVNVGVNVGLAPGLEQTAPPEVSSVGARRTDVGVGATAL